MGIWRVLGCAALGVGAVVLAPATGGGSLALAIGAMGTTTAAGAAIGAAGGAAIGALASSGNGDKDKVRADRAEAKLVEQAIKLTRVQEQLEKIRLGDINRFHQFVVAASALGICVANCDGEIHPSERADIEEFISGASAASLPRAIVDQIDRLYRSPPTIQQAAEYIRPLANDHWGVFEEIIQTVIDADGREGPEETAFMEAWSHIATTLVKKSRFSRHVNVRRA